MRLRLDLGYDGTRFHGWAAQPGLRTVQGELEAALALLLTHIDVVAPRLTVAGRTDAGVHARGQVAHLDVPAEAEERLTVRRVHGILSRRGATDIVVHRIHEAAAGFEARFSALNRRYEYRIRDAKTRRDPLTARFTAELPYLLNLEAMQRASEILLGLRDFSTFCKAREGATTVRQLQHFDWQEASDGVLIARVQADAFCHSMVRALVGAVVAVGQSRISLDELIRLRDARQRSNRFTVMPAHGLSLEEVRYPPDAELATRARQTRHRRNSSCDAVRGETSLT